ncbi:MAG: hypothetical protein WA136_01125 [Rhodoferax sp.]
MIEIFPTKFQMIFFALTFALVTVFPIKLAANYADSENSGLVGSVVASLIAPFVAIVAFRFVSGGFNGFVLAYIGMLVTYVAILRIPIRSVVRFSILLLALQIATFMALISFGFNLGKLLLG